MSEKARKVGLIHFEWRKKMRKFGICHLLGRKKCGNLNFVVFYVGKSAESWTLLFLLAKKVRKVGLWENYTKLNQDRKNDKGK
jgi:hypothetical protein